MTILVYTPLHPDYGTKPQTLDSIMALECDQPFDRVLADNDSPVLAWEKGAANKRIAHNYNEARRLVLDNGRYDVMLTVEADMIVPPDAITKLTAVDADVVYGVYVFRKTLKLNIRSELTQWGSKVADTSLLGRDEVVPCAGVGLGCTLIRRHVLENIEFRLFDKAPGMLACDWRFAIDCQELGFTQAAHMGVLCGHIDGEEVLYPLNREVYYGY